jgi:flagellar basal-body rod protein FlgB
MGQGFYDVSIERAVQTLDWCVRRQRLITSNIANRDTPGYQARDVDFDSLMEQIHGSGGAGRALRRTDARHLPASSGAGSAAVIVKKSSNRLDGNTVSLSEEMSNLVKNGYMYQAFIKRLSKKFQALKLAINGGG